MIPEKNQYIKVLLKNNIQLEGIVENWDKDVTLRSLDGKSLIIIPHPDDDIVVIRIILEQEEPTKIPPPKNEIEKEISHVVETTTSSDDNWRLQRLSELRKELAAQDKKIISEKLQSHSITNTNELKYGSQFLTVKSIK